MAERTPATGRRITGGIVLVGMVLAVLGLRLLEQRIGGEVLRYGAEGVVVRVEVTRIGGDAVKPIAHFWLERDGVRREGSAAVDRPPPRPGDVVVGRYLLEDPLRVRLKGVDAAAAAAETEPFRGMQWILLVTGVFLAVVVIAPQHVGWAFGALMVTVFLGVNAFADVQQTMARAWGPAVLGVPIVWVVTGVELVLIAPAVLVASEALFALVQGLKAGGRSAPTGAGGLAVVMLQALPEPLRSPQRRLRIAGGYLLLVGLGWIAWAAARGI